MRSDDWMFEMVRAEVDAVPEKMVPEVVRAVVEAKVMVPLVAVMAPAVRVPIVAEFEKRAELDAVVANDADDDEKVMLPKTDAKLVEVLLRAEKFVEEAYEEKRRDDVALASTTSPLKVLVPVQVLLVERSEDPVERQTPLIEKQPEEISNPTLDVEVAKPEIFNPERVVVPKP